MKKHSEYVIPVEFKNRLDKSPALRNAFYALTPGRQRAYILYFSSPKLPEKRESRIEKSITKILDGLGLRD